MARFTCSYELDQRPDRPLVSLCQQAYRFVQSCLGGTSRISVLPSGELDAVQVYVYYVASLLHGAADAGLTLVLHNLGREARAFERSIFEYVHRADYYIDNPADAQLYLASVPFREKQILDDLNYPKDSARYVAVDDWCRDTSVMTPDAAKYKEPTLMKILGDENDPAVRMQYAFRYRVHSQTEHATIAGLGSVFSDRGLSFNSRQDDPNLTLEAITGMTLDFLDLMNKALRLNVEADIAAFKVRFDSVEARLWESRGKSVPDAE